ncbi:MAG: hypothetical protein KF819_38195, partial [Labilithrix sp.]|nr:hypothetical protein [Labilithrix sp.]
LADRTYLEPLDRAALSAIVAAEAPDAILPLFGGPSACRLALDLAKPLLGPSADALRAALDAPSVTLDERSSTRLELIVACDDAGGTRVLFAIESLDRAGVHPGDAVSATPPITIAPSERAAIEAAAIAALARVRGTVATVDVVIDRGGAEARVVGLTPWISRSCALASTVGGASVGALATGLALGGAIPAFEARRDFVVRWPRFAFETFPDADAALGPLRKSLGESIGVGPTLAEALRAAARGEGDGVGGRGTAVTDSREGARAVIVIGPGPTRVGHGPELAVSASEALAAVRERGFSPVFVDASVESLEIARASADRVHVEPVTLPRVLAICARERAAGVVLQVGGETALRLAGDLAASGVKVFGSSPPHAPAASPPDLHRAIALHVDAVSDGARVVIAGVMEQLEPAFVHPGDAAAILPAFTLRADVIERVEALVIRRALDLGIVGLVSAHVAIIDGEPLLLELFARAGRTTAFVSRVTGFPLVRVATKVMLGATLDELGIRDRPLPRHVAARERVFPFERLGVDTALGPEMRSTGEVIGLDDTAARAYGKALRAMGNQLLDPANAARGVVVDVTEPDRGAAVEIARRLRAIGYDIVALGGTKKALAAARVPFRELASGDDLDAAASEIASGWAALAIVTAGDQAEIARTRVLRGAALAAHIPCFTTVALARLGCAALEEGAASRVRSLQDWYAADV